MAAVVELVVAASASFVFAGLARLVGFGVGYGVACAWETSGDATAVGVVSISIAAAPFGVVESSIDVTAVSVVSITAVSDVAAAGKDIASVS